MKSILRKIVNVYYFINNIIKFKIYKIQVKTDVFNNIRGILYIKSSGKIIIEKNVRINSRYSANPIGGQEYCTFVVGRQAFLNIDEGEAISNSTIVSNKGVYIGKDVYIGGDCKIYDTDFHSLKYEERILNNDPGVRSKEVNINKGAFIGTGTIILKGVNIGEEAVIGAGSVVTSDIPNKQIWAGNPARYIRDI